MSLYGQRIDETGLYVSGGGGEFALGSRDLVNRLKSNSKADVVAWVIGIVAMIAEKPPAWIAFDFDETTGMPLDLTITVPSE